MTRPRSFLLTILFLLAIPAASFLHADEPAIVKEDFTFKSTLDDTGPIYATAVYPEGARDLPIMIVMHGYWGNRTKVYFSAERFAKKGFFCLAIQPRGWGGVRKRRGKVIEETEKSAGSHDDGGVETHDIWDGLHAGIDRYGEKVDPEKVSIVGYSNGGAMTYFATVRFPFLFRGAMAFFGIPDYGRWTELHKGFKKHVKKAVGALPEDAPDRFKARSATRAAGNLSGTRFHIVHDEKEKLCPLPMIREFVAAAKATGYEKLFVHESQAGDERRWTHGYNRPRKGMPEGYLSPMEDLFVEDLSKHNTTKPVMPATGELTVLGYLVTPKFKCVAGTGENAVATVAYDFGGDKATLRFTPVTSKKDEKLVVTIRGEAARGLTRATVDGRRVALPKEGPKTVEGTIGSTIVFER